MSGPVDTEPSAVAEPDTVGTAGVEIAESRTADVGAITVRRALPQRHHRLVGSWCFADHLGPTAVTEHEGVDIGPHPHTGLQTVTWLFAGEILHRDSLGSEQVIRPGQLNLMTAGRGVAHSEERTGHYAGALHGMQLWVAQPEATRHGDPEFEHHAELPGVELDRGTATVLVGRFAGAESPARRDTAHLGVELRLAPGATVLPLDPTNEHALVVAEGELDVEGRRLVPGHLGLLGTGRRGVELRALTGARGLLLGGPPFGEEVLMWWNFVARTRDEVTRAYTDWVDPGGLRFGAVASDLDPLPVRPPRWVRA